MSECERCGDEVSRLFRHRVRTETMTHRRTRRVCATCHPSVPDSAASDHPPERIVPDGGTQAITCPTCSGTTIDDGTVVTCADCGWTGGR